MIPDHCDGCGLTIDDAAPGTTWDWDIDANTLRCRTCWLIDAAVAH